MCIWLSGRVAGSPLEIEEHTMEITVALFSTLVAAGCLIATVASDLRDNRSKEVSEGLSDQQPSD